MFKVGKTARSAFIFVSSARDAAGIALLAQLGHTTLSVAVFWGQFSGRQPGG